jgi:HK97 gp10 family phage protein
MVGKVTFEIEGAKEIEALLRDMGPKVATRIGDKALKAAARPIVKEAKRLVPVKTGRLRRSITARKGKSDGPAERSVVIGFKPPGRRYAHLVEFGTSHSAAKPFFRPALDARARDALAAMTEALADGILRQEWRKALPQIADGIDLFAAEGE